MLRVQDEMISQLLLVRDVMRIGVPTCKLDDTLDKVAALMIDQGATALVVLDGDGEARGWINEARLAGAYLQTYEGLPAPAADPEGALTAPRTAADIMDEEVPECPGDMPLRAAAQLMAGTGADHLFFLHRAGGRTWPASMLSQRDLVRALAGPEYIKNQGTASPRPTPMDLFRQRYGLSGRR